MEDILHYVWKHRLFQQELTTTDGVAIQILDTGQHNKDAGPDFFNAKVRVGDKIWVGNIEIHTSSDDWNKHRHQYDKAYNSVILHVVENATCEVLNEAGLTVPQCEISYPAHIRDNIDFLLTADISLPCCNFIKDFQGIHLQNWISTLLMERLERKTNDIFRLLVRFNNSWTDVFYILLSRSMGFGINSDAFERLVLSLPLPYILKQGDSLLQIEALLLGQAGMLDNIEENDDYTKKICQEYRFLKNKYSLSPLDKEVFKRMRMRPQSAPYIRLAQLAVLLSNIQGLFSKVLLATDPGQLRLLLHINASPYWQTHYTLGEESPAKPKYIGDASLDILIINAIVPILFAYGRKMADETYEERALRLLDMIKPESNTIVKEFVACGIGCPSAFYTQAIIQLKREYCEKKKCLYCRIGYKFLLE